MGASPTFRGALRSRLAAVLAALWACSEPPATAPPASDGAPPDADLSDAGEELDAGRDGLPDLTIDLGTARVELGLRQKRFDAGSCELDPDEDCVGGPGERRLLTFSVKTPNLGTGDMFLGAPDPDNPAFQYSACHDHYHFEGYAEYRLVDARGGTVAVGRKQAFCLLDSERYVTDDPTVSLAPKYRCEYQGIQRGWADVYQSHLPCQFLDITGVEPGLYSLEIELNSERALVELDHDNNLVSLPLDLEDPALVTPTEPCPSDIDPSAITGVGRECGWTVGPTFSCTPGETARVGCSSTCGLGSCTGNPMLRVCDAERPDGNCSHPAAADPLEPGGGESNDFAGPCPCDLSIECPPSGQLQVFTAPFRLGEPYTCEVQFEQ